MSIDTTWLRCPNCLLDLEAVGSRVFGCASGHRFDQAKPGYLTLLPPRAPRTIGDDDEMLAARSNLHERGAFAPIADALVNTVHERPRQTSAARVADLGCGTGHYSAAIARAMPGSAVLLADRSSRAVRSSLRAQPTATGVVLDIWRPLPLRDGVADVILNVFAPRNGAEFGRILAPGGALLVVVPTAAHLVELRVQGALLEVPSNKSERVVERLAPLGFAPRSRELIEYPLGTDTSVQALLAAMGPSAHHRDTLLATDAIAESATSVTVSVELLVFESARR